METESSRTPTEAVIESVARYKGVATGSIEEPLYESVDTEALDSLLAVGDGRIRFEYLDTLVTVDSTGYVSVHGSDPPVNEPRAAEDR